MPRKVLVVLGMVGPHWKICSDGGFAGVIPLPAFGWIAWLDPPVIFSGLLRFWKTKA
jgi:hypothetical protein